MAAYTLTTLFNEALSHMGISTTIGIYTENSKHANVLRRWIDRAKGQIFPAVHWASLRETASLAQLASRDTDVNWTSGDPEPGWLYTLAVPANLALPVHLHDFTRFAMGSTSTGRVIYANHSPAYLTYICNDRNPDYWDEQLRMTLSLGLAALACMELTKKPEQLKTIYALLGSAISTAREQNMLMQDTQLETIPEWFSEAGLETSDFGSTRYYYPVETPSMLSHAPAKVAD